MKRAIREGWGDTSLPDLADLLPAGFDLQWLGSQLVRYRASELERQTTPKREEDISYLQKTSEALHLARELLEPEELPPHADGTAEALAHAVGVDWPGLRHRLRADLEQALSVMQLCAAELAQQPGQLGRPPAHARDVLLRALCTRLRATPMPATDARAIAEVVLVRCRVPVPGDQRAMQRAEKVKRQK